MKVRIGSLTEMPEQGKAKEFLCSGKPVCIANVNGTLTAIDNVCPHRGGPLSDGVILDGKIICPWHGWAFDPETGQSVQVPDTGVKTYALSIEKEDVFLE